MTVAQLHDTGLDTLQPAQLALLNRLLREQTDYLRNKLGSGVVVLGTLLDGSPLVLGAWSVPFTVLVNPRLVMLTREVEEDWEGCLSVPGLRGMVPRFTRLRYRGSDQYGRPIDRSVEGFHARVAAATLIAVGTAFFASNYSNIMDYLQTLFGFFNAPLFATFILGMFWKRMTATAGWVGLSAGTLSAVLVAFLTEDAFGTLSLGVIPLKGQGAAFVAASAAFVVDIVLSVVVSLMTEPKPAGSLRGLVYSETPREDLVDPEERKLPWFRRTLPLAGVSLGLVIILNFLF